MSDVRTLTREAFAHFAAGRTAEAVSGYRRAIAADPCHVLAWNGLAMALARQGDLDGAIEAGLRLVELQPDEPLAHTSLSMFYQRKGMIPEAEQEKALAASLAARRG